MASPGDLDFNETLAGIVYQIADDGTVEAYANVIRSPDDSFKGPDGMAFAADGTLVTEAATGSVEVIATGRTGLALHAPSLGR